VAVEVLVLQMALDLVRLVEVMVQELESHFLVVTQMLQQVLQTLVVAAVVVETTTMTESLT
jgi:hypothetical protein